MVSPSPALDSLVSTTGTEEGKEVDAGHSVSSMTGDWTSASAGMVLLLDAVQTGRDPTLSVATGARALLPKTYSAMELVPASYSCLSAGKYHTRDRSS